MGSVSNDDDDDDDVLGIGIGIVVGIRKFPNSVCGVASVIEMGIEGVARLW